MMTYNQFLTRSALIGPNQSVSRGVYGMAIRNALPTVPDSFIAAHIVRIDLAYDFGEPIEMIAEELRFRYEHRPHPEKTPLQMAKRVFKV